MANFICGLYNLRDLDEINLKIKNEVHKLSKSHLRLIKNRYSCDLEYESSLKDKISKLNTYYKILNRLKDQSLSGYEICLDKESLQCLIEKIIRIIGKNCVPELKDYCIDKSREDEWVVKNPYCRSYEDWEKWSKFLCEKLHLNISSETEKLTSLILEITQETITPNVLLAISAYTEVRENLNLKISRSDDEIKLDFKLLLEKIPSCNLNLNIYQEMIKNHKLSFDIVKTIYDEGLSLELTKQNVELKTPVNVYNLSQLSGEINPSYLKKFGMKTTLNKQDLLQDYK